MLRKYGVRFGAFSIFLPALLKPAPAHLILLLHAVFGAGNATIDLPTPPAPGLTSAPTEDNVPDFFYPALGFRVCGPRAVRLDMLERLADAIRPKIAARAELGHGYGGAGFVADADLMSLVGCSGEAFDGLLASLGFKPQTIRVKKMPEAKPVEDAAPAADAPAEAALDASGEATPRPAPDAGEVNPQEATPKEATEAPAAEETATTETDPTDKPTTAENAVSETEIAATDAAEDASETAASDDANADAEDDGMEEIVLWRPVRKNRGPQGPRSRAADGEPNARTGGAGKPGGPARGKGPRKGGKKGGPNAGGKGGHKGPRQMSARPPRSEQARGSGQPVCCSQPAQEQELTTLGRAKALSAPSRSRA